MPFSKRARYNRKVLEIREFCKQKLTKFQSACVFLKDEIHSISLKTRTTNNVSGMKTEVAGEVTEVPPGKCIYSESSSFMRITIRQLWSGCIVVLLTTSLSYWLYSQTESADISTHGTVGYCNSDDISPNDDDCNSCPEFAICRDGNAQCTVHRQLVDNKCVYNPQEIEELRVQMLSYATSILSSLRADHECKSCWFYNSFSGSLVKPPDRFHATKQELKSELFRWFLEETNLFGGLDNKARMKVFQDTFKSMTKTIKSGRKADKTTVLYQKGKGYFSNDASNVRSNWCQFSIWMADIGFFTISILILFVILAVRSARSLTLRMYGGSDSLLESQHFLVRLPRLRKCCVFILWILAIITCILPLIVDLDTIRYCDSGLPGKSTIREPFDYFDCTPCPKFASCQRGIARCHDNRVMIDGECIYDRRMKTFKKQSQSWLEKYWWGIMSCLVVLWLNVWSMRYPAVTKLNQWQIQQIKKMEEDEQEMWIDEIREEIRTYSQDDWFEHGQERPYLTARRSRICKRFWSSIINGVTKGIGKVNIFGKVRSDSNPEKNLSTKADVGER